MTVWVVVWVVLMMFWFFGGAYWAYNGPNPSPITFGANTLIPFLCVLLLGLLYFGAISGGTVIR